MSSPSTLIDDVALLEAGLGRRAAGRRPRRSGSPRSADRPNCSCRSRGHRLGAHTHVGVGRFAGVDDLVGHSVTVTAGMAKPMLTAPVWLGRFVGHVDADHLAARVGQRAAGVARADGRVGLDEVGVAPRLRRLCTPSMLRLEAGHDAQGHRVLVAERAADGDGVLTHLGQRRPRTWRPEGPCRSSTLMTARSVRGSRPTMVAGSFSPVARVTSMLADRVAVYSSVTTWLLVMIMPSER